MYYVALCFASLVISNLFLGKNANIISIIEITMLLILQTLYEPATWMTCVMIKALVLCATFSFKVPKNMKILKRYYGYRNDALKKGKYSFISLNKWTATLISQVSYSNAINYSFIYIGKWKLYVILYFLWLDLPIIFLEVALIYAIYSEKKVTLRNHRNYIFVDFLAFWAFLFLYFYCEVHLSWGMQLIITCVSIFLCQIHFYSFKL